MKVLLIDVNYKNSSTGKLVYSLSSYVRAAGDNAAVCYGRGAKVSEDGIYKFGIDIETYAHALMTRLTGWTGCFSYFSTKRLIRFIEKYRPDVIHIHELHAYFVNIKMLLSYIRKTGIPVVWTFHCEFMYTGKCGHSYECNRWECGCGDCPDVRRYPSSLLFDHTRKMLAEKVDICEKLEDVVVTVPSPWLYSQTIKSFWGKRDVRVVFNGIDSINTFYIRETLGLRKELGIPESSHVILSVAQNLIIRTGNNIRDIAMQMPDLTFVMVGVPERPKDYPSNIITIPCISEQTRLAELYSLSDIFLLCSKKETFSMPCAEALSCGTPVVGYCCGAPESIFEAPYAIFTEYGNQQEICRLIRHRLDTPIPKEQCSKYASEHFSEVQMCAKFYELYQEEANK